MKLDKDICPKQYNINEFIEYLKKIKINNKIITICSILPEKVIKNDIEYTIYINKIWYNKENTYYHFEMNYYSIDVNEFLFSPKVFYDVETSIIVLYTNLVNINLIDDEHLYYF